MRSSRIALAEVIHNKAIADEELRQLDKRLLYDPKLDEDAPSSLRDSFVQLECDEATQAFVAQAEDKSDRFFTQLWHSLVSTLLGLFLTQTTLNGLLGRGCMFVFSANQFSRLMDGCSGGRLLDIGAGDGSVTAQMESFFNEVSVTEVSPTMRKILAKRNYKVLDIDNWEQNGPWDVISCLNVLDRCAKPLTLLRQIHGSLIEGGKVVIALVLPYKPYVEVGGTANHLPKELLDIKGEQFHEQVASFIHDTLIPLGFTVEKWTRVPYFCEGDLSQAYYFLSDAVFILSKVKRPCTIESN